MKTRQILFRCKECKRGFMDERGWEAHHLFFHGRYVEPCSTKESYKQNLDWQKLADQLLTEQKRMKRAANVLDNFKRKMAKKYNLDDPYEVYGYDLSINEAKELEKKQDKYLSIFHIFTRLRRKCDEKGVIPI